MNHILLATPFPFPPGGKMQEQLIWLIINYILFNIYYNTYYNIYYNMWSKLLEACVKKIKT
jgi:hypothetical protein